VEDNIYSKYPYLENRKNAKLIRIKICPINKASNHKEGSVSITREAVKNLISQKQLLHMPIHYTKVSKDLPKTHSDNNKYIEIGHIISEGDIISEEGVEYLEVDALLHSESQKQYVDDIINNIELLGNSWELIPEEGYKEGDTLNITRVNDFIGNAILDKEHTAFRNTKIVYASIEEQLMEESVNWEQKYKELLIEIDQIKQELKYSIERNTSLSNENYFLIEKCSMLREMCDMFKSLLESDTEEEDDEDEMED
jgi:hypothetical protein